MFPSSHVSPDSTFPFPHFEHEKVNQSNVDPAEHPRHFTIPATIPQLEQSGTQVTVGQSTQSFLAELRYSSGGQTQEFPEPGISRFSQTQF